MRTCANAGDDLRVDVVARLCAARTDHAGRQRIDAGIEGRHVIGADFHAPAAVRDQRIGRRATTEQRLRIGQIAR